ncbi:MAG: DUF1697 domain-containing protein [Notoacmeibacter sp.]|nr:DUF1697 domain-containing protein [Notoacmeibacter sp.]
MTRYVALLRAVNVGGTGKLPMTMLAAMCADAGFAGPRTFIASGNVVFGSDLPEGAVKAELETRLATYAGKPVGVMARTAEEMAAIRDANPFSSEPGNKVAVIFLDAPPPSDALERAKGQTDEVMHPGAREIYVFYPSGQGRSKLRIPAAAAGTARNMNTVAKLAEIAAEG